jgi:cytosine/adenosine deaminase-related metal-dependent hydrolase
MPIIIKNGSLLLGKSLRFVNNGFIEIGKNGIITNVGRRNYNAGHDNKDKTYELIDAEGFMILPGFINAHTHIGDSIGKDIAVESGLDKRVHPVLGVKRNILHKSKPDHLKTFMRNSALSMMKRGIIAFADFREDGIVGIRLLKEALSGLPIKCIILGRVEYYLKPKDESTGGVLLGGKKKTRKRTNTRLPSYVLKMLSTILKASDGIGLSGANENTDESLLQYRELLWGERSSENKKKKLLLAIHAAESEDTVQFSKLLTGRTEVSRIMQYLRPDILVHMTNPTDEDISIVRNSNVGIVLCPRANGILGSGIPRVSRMIKTRCIIGLGTDNVMLNSPDMFKEMDYLWKVSRATETRFITATEILKMSTVYPAQILNLNSGTIDIGKSADLLFIDKHHIDLYPMHDPHASIVQRAGQETIRAVMINGEFVSGDGI